MKVYHGSDVKIETPSPMDDCRRLKPNVVKLSGK